MPRRAWPGLVGLALGVIVLGPALAPGFVLTYDMVFVPDPPAPPAMFGLTGGFPRPVPSDAVVAALAVPLPAQIVQKLVLLAIFVLAAWGAARLVPAAHPLPRLAAAVGYAWNPYVAERLVLGHWALLLGYAGLPWAVRAAATVGDRGGVARLTRSLVPAAVGGFAALNVSALVVGAVVALRPRRGPGPQAPEAPQAPQAPQAAPSRWRRPAALAWTALVVGVLSIPWLVPAVLQRLAAGRDAAGATDPAGVDLFAARADTPFGSLGSLLSLGGIWNREVVPPGLGAWPGAAARLALSLGALAFFLLRVRRARGPDATAEPWLGGLAAAAGIGLLIACFGITGPGRAALRWLVEALPVFGALRDAQVWIAPLALVEAVGLAAMVSAVLAWRPRAERAAASRAAASRAPASRPAAAGERLVLAGLIAAAPMVLLPTFGWGAGGRLASVQYPGDWAAARRIIERDPVPGAVLSLPWAAHRRPAWNDGRTTLDPLPRAVSRRVVWNDGLRVGGRDLAPEDPAAGAAAALLRGSGPLTEPLRRAGYRFVVVADGGGPEPGGGGPPGADENRFQARLTGARRVFAGRDLTVYQLPRGASPARFTEVGAPPRGVVLTADLIPLLLTVWSFGASGSTLLALRTQ
ncbi:MAG TPA: hypothetical protein VFU43_05635 [Streptosporangiaceae bacterium]|nr:hypothetical protein [Streptosporangiaceae bacterium]